MVAVPLNMHKRKCAKTRNELLNVLSQCSDVQTLQLLWAVNVLQSDMPPNLSRYLKYPPSAAKAKIGDKAFALKWEIESLLLLMLSTPKTTPNVIPARYFEFDMACILMNLFKKAEEAENKIRVIDVTEMQRYAHRQFLWQRNFLQNERLYRYYYVYGQGECAAYFKEKNGLSVEEFAIACVGLFLWAHGNAWEHVPHLGEFKMLRQEIIHLALKIISRDLVDLRNDTAQRIHNAASKSSSKLSYLPSSLRQYPVISSSANGGRIIAPLPQLIMLRATSGLYYDLVEGPQALTADANDRFEQYCKKLIEARCPRFVVSREKPFGPKKAKLWTPDLLLSDGPEIKVVFECKATKLTYEAQYADNQYAEATKAFDQIAKGMSQLWKFFSRARQGTYAEDKVRSDAIGVILTMDNWFHLEGTQLPAIRKKAEELVADEPGVLLQDMRDVIFCSIEELDDVLAVSDEDEFLDTLRRQLLPQHRGWQLPSVRNPGWEKVLERKGYPFEISEVIPLWDELGRA
ncbi:MAG: hypothetical protein E5Y06_31380 [Mesorhizobium sp.]|uniref:hypothetical protein n=1 Tax=Mesorhizobium sp. TaxID=1871066 RepID=UPI0012073ADD|nr:hypothetical protein [Mesorhizobium sp.]TIN90681.1 MAG: hypothetical protein E5Y06_31380 [Mesorhizobium sp.]TJU95707.1 MAG: hypothetical protein E5Y08_24195 [Mesorhizobium sp.]